MKRIFVHGLGQTPAGWEPVLRLLDGQPDCACPDLAELAPAGEVTYPGLFRAFARFCDGAEFRMVEGAGHELNREAPEKLAPLLRAFEDRTHPRS